MYNKKLIFSSACMGMLLFGISMITLGSVVPDLRIKLGIDEISAGMLFSILPFGILTGSLLFGPIADRKGYRLLLSVSCIILFAGFEGVAYSTSGSLLGIFVFLIGLGGGAINGATNALVSDLADTGKGADLNLLGVFYGIGALGMPLIMGLLRNILDFDGIVAVVGILSMGTGVFYIALKFPPPKQEKGIPFSQNLKLLGDKLLLLISLFLFFESSFEGIINNWTTLFVINNFHVPAGKALFALSSFVAGMAVMRVITGFFLRNIKESRILSVCFILIAAGLIILKTGIAWPVAATGLFILGAGLSYGFPVMLGFIGARFAGLSGSAMSIAFVVALIGNMSVNYAMGHIVKGFGIGHLVTVAAAEFLIMVVLSLFIFKKL